MKQHRRLNTLGLIGILLLLLSLVTITTATAVQGSVRIVETSGATTTLAWTNKTAIIILEVTDSDLDKPLKRVLFPGDSTALTGRQSSVAGSTSATSDTDISAALAVGDTVLFPGEERVKKVATVALDGLTFTTTTPFSLTQSNVLTREVTVAGGKFGVCPNCTNADSFSLTTDTDEKVFTLSNFPQLDINVSNSGFNAGNLPKRFTGAPDTALNKLDIAVVDSAGAPYLNAEVTALDGPNGTLRLICRTACVAGTAYGLYWTSTADTEGTVQDPASTSLVTAVSQADAGGIGVVITETGASTDVFERSLELCNTTGCTDKDTSPPKLEVGANDVVTLTYKDANGASASTSVTVESDAPGFANLAPSHNSSTTSPLPIVSGDATDTGAGVKKTTLRVVFNVSGTVGSLDPNLGVTGSVSTIGGGYAVTQQRPSIPAVTNASVMWWIKADDLAGNKGVSDKSAPTTLTGTVSVSATAVTGTGTKFDTELVVGQTITVGSETRRVNTIASPSSLTVDAGMTTATNELATKSTCVESRYSAIGIPTTTDNGGCDPFVVKVDNAKPDMNAAFAGYWWDTTITTADKTNSTADKAKKSNVAVDFNESIDTATIQVSDFTVTVGTAAVSVISADHYAGMATRVFLTLGEDLAADAKPVVKLVGEVKDPAGNDLTIDQVTASDNIGPTVTVTVTGTGGSVPVTKNKVTVQFTTDESVTVTSSSVEVKAQGTATLVTGSDLATVAPSLVTAKTWKVDVTPPGPGVFNVFVSVVDLSNNQGNKGTEGTMDNPIGTTSILFEKDTGVGAPVFTPSVSTDDPNGFIVIDYAAEGKEYGLDGLGNFTAVADDVVTDKDTHGKVTLTSATLDGVDILSSVVTEDSIRFLYKSSELALGDHTLKVEGTDDAGNVSLVKSNAFEVVAMKAFEVKLLPGWNLVSIPGVAADPGINSVIGTTHPIAAILTYDAGSGLWLTAVRDTGTGLFMGTLTTISATQAYWVRTDTFQSLNVLLATALTGMVPRSISLGAGWNMVPVVTPNPQGTTVGFSVDEDVYLPSGWARAYGYDTLTGGFVAVSPGAVGENLKAGQGYWVYMTKAGTIIP